MRSHFLLAVGVLLCASGCSIIIGPATFGDGDGGQGEDATLDGGADAGPRDAGDSSTPECVGSATRPCAGGIDTGECSPGTQHCIDGTWGACEGAQGPTDEVCDRLDNDCDGVIDGIAATIACGDGQACVSGECVVTMCPDFMLDCDMNAGNGCEVDSRTDADHCGECGHACAWACSDALCTDPVGLAGGRFHTCASGDIGVFCWGDNLDGQLGIGSTTDANQPTAVLGLSSAQALAAGASHTCAVRLGTVHCWGANTSGQLGVSGASDQLVPVPTSVTDATALAAGQTHTCAIRTTGQAFCWGAAGEGQLGDGTTGSTGYMPRPVSGLLSVTQIAAGGTHTCAIAGGALYCWGRNREGQVGTGSATFTFSSPQAVSTVSAPAGIALGRNHSCARTSSGQVYCWGDNTYGQVGTGSVGGSVNAPVLVSGLSGVDELTAGDYHVCARIGDRVSCWGDNREGQLALPSGIANSATPQPVVGLTDVLDVEAGGRHTCVRKNDGNVECWGRGLDGQIGDGANEQRRAPTLTLPPGS